MNRNLRTSIGIITLVLAVTVVSEVNAQSTYTTHSGWYVSPSQPIYESAIPQSYRSASLANQTFAPQSYNSQSYNSYWAQPIQQNNSWTQSYTQPNRQSISPTPTQIHQESNYAQRLNFSSYSSRPANVVGCQTGGT